MVNIGIINAIYPFDIKNTFPVLNIHRYAFEAVGDFGTNRITIKAAALLEISKLGYFHTIQPYFPSQPPGPQGRRFPVIFHQPDIMFIRFNPQVAQTIKVEVNHIIRRRFEYHLVLIIVLEPVGIFSITAVSRPAGRLHIGYLPRLRSQGPQKSGRIHGSRTFFHIIGLLNNAALFTPVVL